MLFMERALEQQQLLQQQQQQEQQQVGQGKVLVVIGWALCAPQHLMLDA